MRLFHSARWLLLALLVSLVPASSYAGVFISVNFGPPVLPVYVQPVCPQPDLIWTPGYWAYGDEGYFWVPGAWVPAPFVGGLWTPGYWGWSNGLYVFNPGYWGYHVGYYGGVNYGGGYLGIGFAGGEWRGGHMAYNTAVVNVNTTIIHTTYVNRTIIETNTVVNNNHVAYSGGPGGVQHQPTPTEQIAAHETHTPPTTFQAQHVQAAQTDKTSYAKANGGHPTNLAVAKPLPVESHPAPARPTGTPARPANAANPGTREGTGAGAGKAPPTSNSERTPAYKPAQTPPSHPESTSPRTNEAPPRTNTAPKPSPKPPAPKPAEKPRPEEPKK
jgi:WXXGXW repeat (2 copies)